MNPLYITNQLIYISKLIKQAFKNVLKAKLFHLDT